MLKHSFALILLILGYIVLPLFLPWWTVAIPAAVFGFFAQNRLSAFAQASTLLALVWGIWAQVYNLGNGGLLAGKMGLLFGGLQAMHLVFITAALGGLIGGLFGLTGFAAKQLLR